MTGLTTLDSPVDLDEHLPLDLDTAVQQPSWADPVRAAATRAELARLPGLVTDEEVRQLRALLAEAASGHYEVIQAGDCAEDPAECDPSTVMRKAGLLDALAGVMVAGTGRPVLRIGRIAGQFAKPRSTDTELVDGVELPVYRGHLINGPEPTPADRRADPRRMLDCYHAAAAAVTHLRQRTSAWTLPSGAPVWTSHEALVFDYELPLLRRAASGRILLTSTHLPWIGERTRQPDGPHVMMLARIANPVACKVGPTMRPEELLALCARLDPERESGRLTLISRMGADAVSTALPPLVTAVQEAGHRVVWLCDPMHGNTVKSPSGAKVRSVRTLAAEVLAFRQAVTEAGGTPAGLHLETTPFDVAECVWGDPAELGTQAPGPARRAAAPSHCDPRLNPAQAVELARTWADPLPRPT
ncbi:phospho-2-dehydro-3-deoxyheptonate aldolase [Kitasatospora sp. MMS16-BH015]|uniref:3-deoxy-7-phosphoheptulonate synthase n=1 Tax=Kitasatospora sp. MMS16-BH015 TaxID=2018025 RepID=UPI000CA39D21|nr:3-deoxy-7-phosphoheptulonate synthase [Kitasatospora sp. MMS16-BH015]AUG79103.1 phospho-2-dehydro-3-deoxyheptonate aldolase [Kitasatospora sp. MMS16-BH015]